MLYTITLCSRLSKSISIGKLIILPLPLLIQQIDNNMHQIFYIIVKFSTQMHQIHNNMHSNFLHCSLLKSRLNRAKHEKNHSKILPNHKKQNQNQNNKKVIVIEVAFLMRFSAKSRTMPLNRFRYRDLKPC